MTMAEAKPLSRAEAIRRALAAEPERWWRPTEVGRAVGCDSSQAANALQNDWRTGRVERRSIVIGGRVLSQYRWIPE